MITHPDGGRSGRMRARAWLADATSGGDEGRAAEAAERMATPDQLKRLLDLGWYWLAADQDGFPHTLTTLTDPPLGVFVRGKLPVGPEAAIVGARKATAYGREVAEHLGRELAAAGVAVVSGMARGVDAAAHRGALAGGGATVAVWGAGPDRVYPAEHERLAAEIAVSGCLLTEYPLGTPPLPQHFPERNRIIAGLVGVVVVVEADERSGALITARAALDEGRDVMAVPGSIFSRLSAGPNALLREGAAPVLTTGDVLAVLGVAPAPASRAPGDDGLLAFLPHGEAVSVDHLAAAAGLPIGQVIEELLRLELDGRVIREADGRYRHAGARPTT